MVVTEEGETFVFFNNVEPEDTKKETSHAANSNLFLTIFFYACGKIIER